MQTIELAEKVEQKCVLTFDLSTRRSAQTGVKMNEGKTKDKYLKQKRMRRGRGNDDND